MKIIHCADIHLDSKMSANLTKEKARERKTELLTTFQNMVTYGAEQGVAAIIIAGDLFDTKNVSATARNVVKDLIQGHPKIAFYYLQGNHDEGSFTSGLSELPENLHLFGNNWTSYELSGTENTSGKGVAVTGVELTPENSGSIYNTLSLDVDQCNIVVLHGQESEYSARDKAEIIHLTALKNKGIDYLALGHVHEYQSGQLDNRGMYCYSGCLEGRGFDECGQKGFVVLDIDDEKLTAGFSFVPFAYRSLYTLYVDVTGAMTTQDVAVKMEKAISDSEYSSRSMVKFVLVGEVDVDCEINTDFLKDMFEEYFYYEKVYDETRLLINYSEYEKDASLKGEFIRMVLGSDMTEEQKSEVIRCGISALSGEEI